ncbi:hypothetical protein BJ322DRAFT_1021727 [Thelephora terrestris]|uniref:Uncharacterized protein n=1 Tax=Thelephora terrestris TaxID=56493 RepID=A0A9P6L5U7_9AGAM|nr:hypothetical protein BJ322DRAFT_1021727 [Thelephora terrestris]
MTGANTSKALERSGATVHVTVAEHVYSGEPTARRYLEEGPLIPNWVSTNLGFQRANARIEVKIVGTGHVGGWNRYAAWHLDAVVEVDGVLKKTRNNKGKETKTWHVEGIANSCDDFKRKSREWEDSE